jgi:hypothetical protein
MTRSDTGRTRIPHATAGVPEQRSRDTALHDALRAEPPASHDFRWGPVWAGALTTLSTLLVLRLVAFALGWVELPAAVTVGARAEQALLVGVIALLAFFHGGVLAGATSAWRGARSGLVSGVLVWALTVTALLALALAGKGALLEPLTTIAAATPLQPQALTGARATAAWSALGLGLAATAAGLGGVYGARTWPGRHRGRGRRRGPSAVIGS